MLTPNRAHAGDHDAVWMHSRTIFQEPPLNFSALDGRTQLTHPSLSDWRLVGSMMPGVMEPRLSGMASHWRNVRSLRIALVCASGEALVSSLEEGMGPEAFARLERLGLERPVASKGWVEGGLLGFVARARPLCARCACRCSTSCQVRRSRST